MNARHALAFATLAIAASGAFAQTAAAPPRDFATRKTDMLAHLDQHIAAMTTMRGCVANAQSKDDVKVCRQQNRDAWRARRHQPA